MKKRVLAPFDRGDTLKKFISILLIVCAAALTLEAARLSKDCGCGLVCGCRTVSRGLVRKSAAVSDRGKLLGISDMLHVLDCEDFKSGSSLGFYKVNGFKIVC